MAYSPSDIQNYINNIYASGGTDRDVAAAMDQYGVTPNEVASAFNVPVSQVQSTYDAATPSGAYSTASRAPAPTGIASLPAAVPAVAQAASPDYSQMSPTERAQVIRDYVAQVQAANPGNDTAVQTTLAQAMDQYGVDVNEFANATGYSPADVQSVYNTVNPTGKYFAQAPALPQPLSPQQTPPQAAIPGAPQSFTDQEVIDYVQNEIVGKMGLQPGTDAYYRAVGNAAQQFQIGVPQLARAFNMPEQQISQYVVDQGLNIPGVTPGTTKTPTLPDIKLAPPVTGEGISTQFIREAPEIEAYKLGLMQEAKRLYEQPIKYNEEGLAYKVADPSAMTIGSYDVAQQGIGAYQPFVQQGAQTLAQGQGLAQQAATMGQLGLGAYLSATGQYNPAQTAQFMNPYQQLVTDQALREIRRQADIAGQGQAAQAVRAGAFGGTREGVQRAEMERNTQDIMSQRIAQDLAQNYAQAQQASQSAYEAQQQRAIAAGQGIGGLTGTYGSLGSQLGQLGVQQAALGQAAQQGLTTDVNLLNVLGQQQQAQEQAKLEADRMTNYQRVFDPYTRLGFLSDIYKGAPSTQSTIAATTAQQPSAFQQLVGGVTSGIATAAGAQKLGLF